MKRNWSFPLALLMSVANVMTAIPASATFPGKNGRIAFVFGPDIFTMNPDGSDVRQLTHMTNDNVLALGASNVMIVKVAAFAAVLVPASACCAYNWKPQSRRPTPIIDLRNFIEFSFFRAASDVGPSQVRAQWWCRGFQLRPRTSSTT